MAARGTLRLYLGAAPGVGKTYAMLGEGRRRRDRGTDVVVAFVETHGRARTAEQVGDLEVVPRRTLEHRGASFEELDVDAVLARRPAVALVDELAHTNVPGSRNEKRWQDVEELLDAGIDVISTLNIQHLESLNDVVERITGVTQRETIPDDVARRADQIELVDMSPEALRRRMAHGNVYPAERIDTALGNYFREGNLGALRELALLWVADRVEEALAEYRQLHGIERPWETRERVVVALTGTVDGDRLVRRAARMAQRAKGDLAAVHVRPQDGLATASADALAAQRTLVERLGGTYREVVGDDIGQALVATARAVNATQIVLGATRRSRWNELTKGSVIASVIRSSGEDIDVHVISHAGAGSGSPKRRRPASLPRRRVVAGGLLAVALLTALTVVLAELRDELGLPSVLLLYLLSVVVVSAVGGAWPALGAAVAAFLLVNWYFTPPLYTFTIGETENLLALAVFLVVAATVSGFVSLAARRAAEGQRARAEAEALARLAGSSSVADVLESIRRAFALDGVTLWHRDGDGWLEDAGAGAPAGRDAGAVPVDAHHELALAGRPIPADERRILDAYLAELAGSVKLEELEAEASEAGELERANDLRLAILSAVSHDLRTPLSGIKASVTSLLDREVEWSSDDRSAFLRTIDEEADRLDALIGNLLDMSRLQSGALQVETSAIGLDEVVPAALRSIGARAEEIEVDVSETLPRVVADPGLLERAVANVVENALAHGGGGGVRLIAGVVADGVDLRVVDRGPGVSRELRDRMFVPFQRLGDSPRDGGVGLGLAVARGFVEAMGGEVEVEDTPGRRAHARAPTQGGCMTRVLVVDDEPQILRALAANLRARGYEVDLAGTGEAALTLAQRHRPDAVILDLGLPGIDGLEVIRGLRGWTAVPIVVLSVRDREADKVAALDLGADDYVTKPFGMGELLARLRAALRRATPTGESAVVETAHFTVDLAAKRVRRSRRRRRQADADRVGDRRAPRPQPREARLAAPAAPRGLGPAVRDRDELPARLPRPDQAEARARPGPTALLPHGAADGLPVRAVVGVEAECPDAHQARLSRGWRR